ncbi:ATPase [Flavobacterium akiainvivens]|uniref:ATPase n=1 Tax=Flavobacterium akiainvivens TaxID=1202724 RepID=A0A0M8MG06_9FLAO|nr:ATP-binding protein [Flavobacterium akiainvivens]KOS04828.1 ATPase [Flavobacterium akiainvivens]SFQ43586.1 ATPase family associated with various cellular activities (AAA) [Flavobacterium akiainvivens]
MNVFDLLVTNKKPSNFNDIALSAGNRELLLAFISEQKYSKQLLEHGLEPNNKLLLHGSSGCGKTMTANAIAASLGRNLLTLSLSTIVSARIGETSKSLKLVFDKASREKAVLFLDEFDQLGKSRSSEDTDVGEMRRLVNSIIQLIDYYPSDAVLIAATNHYEVLDIALKRRFQLKISYEMPGKAQLDAFYDNLLHNYPDFNTLNRQYGISYAEAKDYTMTTIKRSLIEKWAAEEAV